jgi:cell division protein FtsQ
MAVNKRSAFNKILNASAWLALFAGIIVLLVAAISRQGNEKISKVEVRYLGKGEKHFVDKKDVLQLLEKINKGKIENTSGRDINLSVMEQELHKGLWIKEAEMFIDNNNVLQVSIREREPVARIFTTAGSSFYIDSTLTILPLNDRVSVRVPVFTGVPGVQNKMNRQDSVLLNDIKLIGTYINNHPFWMAQIDQVNITPEYVFEMVPKLGNQLIRFGDVARYKQKFSALLAFYQQVQFYNGWNKYSVIDLQYKGQIVGVRRDQAEVKADSLRSIVIMKNLIAQAQLQSDDTTSVQLPQIENINPPAGEMIQKPDNNSKNLQADSERSVVAPGHDPEKPIFKNPEGTIKPAIKNPTEKVKAKTKEKSAIKIKPKDPPEPKAVMPAKTDY